MSELQKVGIAPKDLYNVAIYIDYENVYKTLKEKQQNIIRLDFFDKLQIWCTKNNYRIVKIVAYCNYDNIDLYESYHQTLLQQFGIETVHTSNRGKNFSDIKICIDIIKDIYLNKSIDEIIIMSNDSDMTPLLNVIRENKRKVSILTTGNSYNKLLIRYSDTHIRLEDIISIETENIYIKETEEAIYSQITKYYNDKNTKETFNGYSLDYFVDGGVKHFHILKCELYNILSLLHKENKIFTYNYNYLGTMYIGIAPTSIKDNLLKRNIINESNIIDYSFEKKLKDTYNR